MTHATRIVAAVAVLVALAAGGPVQAQDEADAWRERAEQGDADAQYTLGVMYATGRGVPQNDGEAARWVRLAAEQGFAEAQGLLGTAYASGQGVPQDDIQAHMWLTLAAARTIGQAQGLVVGVRDDVAARMTPEQIAEAQRLAREWDLAHPRNP